MITLMMGMKIAEGKRGREREMMIREKTRNGKNKKKNLVPVSSSSFNSSSQESASEAAAADDPSI